MVEETIETIRKAEAEAETIVREAEQKCEQILTEARETARQKKASGSEKSKVLADARMETAKSDGEKARRSEERRVGERVLAGV